MGTTRDLWATQRYLVTRLAEGSFWCGGGVFSRSNCGIGEVGQMGFTSNKISVWQIGKNIYIASASLPRVNKSGLYKLVLDIINDDKILCSKINYWVKNFYMTSCCEKQRTILISNFPRHFFLNVYVY